MTERLTIRSTDGLALEAEWDAPEGADEAFVMCHPHPQMGGTMNAPLLLALRDRLVAGGRAVLRFNFRGIGASEGTSSLGIDEVADAQGALAAARERLPGASVAIGGWSFGAAVAVRATEADRAVFACVAIAPAVKAQPGVTAGLPEPSEVTSRIPLLILCAGRDDLVDPEDCRSWAEATNATLKELPGANHFFWAKYDDLCDAVENFLDEVVPG